MITGAAHTLPTMGTLFPSGLQLARALISQHFQQEIITWGQINLPPGALLLLNY